MELLLQSGRTVHQPAQFTDGKPESCQEKEGSRQVRTKHSLQCQIRDKDWSYCNRSVRRCKVAVQNFSWSAQVWRHEGDDDLRALQHVAEPG